MEVQLEISSRLLANDSIGLEVFAGANSEQGSNVTNHVTNGTNPQKASPYIIEKNGRPVRTRTADLNRVKWQQ